MIIRARVVMTMDGDPIEDGAVAVSGDTITDVGRWAEVRGRNVGEVNDLGEMVLMPGLINAHCHLDYTNLRGAIPPTSSFTDWIRAINARKAELTPQDYVRSISDGLREAARFGTTTIANLEAFPELLTSLTDVPALRVWWFAEMIDVREQQSPAEIHRRLREVFDHTGWVGGIGLAPHAPFTASAKLYSETASVASLHDLPVTTHLAESGEEMAMFSKRTGALFDFMQGIGRPMDDCGKTTPFALLLNQGVLNEQCLVTHLNEVSAGDFSLLEKGPRFHIVHCPRSHAFFKHSDFQFERLQELGFKVCLGTDSLASNQDLSLFAEMREFSRIHPRLAGRELLQLVTVKPASALGMGDSLGRVRTGFRADMTAIPSHETVAGTFEAAVAFDSVVPWLMVNGRELRVA